MIREGCAMTKAIRMDFSSIERLAFECRTCGTVISWKLDDWSTSKVTEKCLGCTTPWLGINHTDEKVQRARAALSFLKELREDALPFMLHIEIPAADEPRG
jgi:hypothetical protein